MLNWFFVLCCLIAFSCREMLPYESLQEIKGYMLKGTVRDVNNNLLDSVAVILHYFTIPAFPVDTQRVYVDDSSQFIDVSVYTLDNVYVRRLLSGYHSVGTILPRYWNGLDNNGNIAPSGKYLLRYTIGQRIVKQFNCLLDGTLTTRTNSAGQFVISDYNLPIGESFDIFLNDESYKGTYRVTSKIKLEFRLENRSKSYDVDILKDKITTGVFVL